MRKKLSKLLCSTASRKTSGRRGGGGGAAGDGEAELSILKRISLGPQRLPSSPSSSSVCNRLKSSAKRRSASPPRIDAVDSAQELSGMICNILQGDHVIPSDSNTTYPYSEPMDAISLKDFLGTSLIPEDHKSPQRKIVSRVRKQLYVFKNTQSRRYNDLMKDCADKIGTEATMEIFGRFGRETGIMEYKTLTKLCIAKARQCTGDDSLCFIHNAYQLLSSMRERGFRIDEESYGPILMLLIDMRMTQEFQSFSALIKDENPGSFCRMAYYEMLFWIKVGDEDKIRELSNSVGVDATENCYNLAESYLLAFCDGDRKEELLELLEVLDVSKISSLKYAASIFKSLGRLQLENFIKKFILTVKTTETGAARASSFIYDYVTSIPNLAVDEIKSTFINLHNQLGVLLSIETCDMLIKLCCSSSKVHHAVDVVDQMCQSGLDVPVKSFHPILHACERHCEFDLVGPIYSMIRQYKMIPNSDTFKSMISLYVRMKDFEGAYKLLTDAAEINEVPTASMYNAIMAGYFREKNNQRALMVLEQMDEANVKPDSETYHYLIVNCECEGGIAKYLDDMRLAGIEPTKHTYMALINAYAKFSNFKLAKQVVLDLVVPSKVLNEIKSALVSALASNGQILDALDIYDQMKQANCNIEPKAAVHLIEHIESDGESKKLFQLLEELNGSSFWFDGCSRVLVYCVRYNITNSAIELLKQLKEKDESSTYFVIDMEAFVSRGKTASDFEKQQQYQTQPQYTLGRIYSNIWKAGSTNLKIGFELLHAIKEELHLHPSRTTLDFLLSSCVKAKDPDRAWLVWSEYEDAGLPYNVVTFLRMYQALLASGKDKAASKMLKKIPKDDRHISLIINSCKMANSTQESP